MKTFNGYSRRCGLWLFCAAYVALPVAAQQQQEAAPTAQSGFSIRETSIYSTYYSTGIPPSLIASGLASGQTGSDIAIGASTVFAYAKQSDRTNVSLLFTPTYSRRVHFTDWSAFSNSLALQFTRSISTRFQFLVGGGAALRNREEFQFNPVSSVPSTGGSASNPTIPMPTPEGQADPAAQSLFFGSRILTANVRMGVRYMLTPRLSLTSGVGSNRTQYLHSRRDGNLQQQTAVIPQVTSILGDFGMSYDLSSRTNIGASVDTSKQQSRLQNALISNARVQVQRILTRHWTVSGYGGVGMFRSLQQQLVTPSSGQLQYITGGSATFQSHAHTIIGSFDRRIADIYGIGASNSNSLSASWRWARPTSRFWTSIGFGQTELQSISFPATTWRGTAEIGRRMSGSLAMTASYSYMGYANTLLPTGSYNQHALRAGFTWVPGVRP
jgi:hypothetical protein